MVGSIFNAPDVIYPDNFKYFVEDLKPKLLWFISLLMTGFKTWRRSFFLECSVPWPHVDYQTVAFLFGSQVKTSNEKIKRTRQLSSPLPQRRTRRRRRRRLAERQQQVGENGILATSVGTSHVVLPYSSTVVWCLLLIHTGKNSAITCHTCTYIVFV